MKKKKIIISIIIVIISIALLVLYSRFIATTGLIVKEYKIVNQNISENFHGLKIVHLSDIHYGRTIQKKELEKVVEKVNFIKPDIVVLTGDLLDQNLKLNNKEIEELTNILKNIKAKYNKYAINGNHDYVHEEWEQIINNSEFINLNNNYDLIYDTTNNPILISGMSTTTYGDMTCDEHLLLTNEYLNKLEEEENSTKPIYKILIMHEPDNVLEFDYSKFDLILAGHSHNGQIRLPFIGAIMLPPKSKVYYDEYYKLNNTDLYISSGLGTSTFNFRLFNRPAFNFYRITNK